MRFEETNTEMIWAENIEPVIPEEAKHTTNGQNFKPWEPQILVTVLGVIQSWSISEGFPAPGRQSGCLLGGLDVFSKDQSPEPKDPQLHQLHHDFRPFVPFCLRLQHANVFQNHCRVGKLPVHGWFGAFLYNGELSCSK